MRLEVRRFARRTGAWTWYADELASYEQEELGTVSSAGDCLDMPRTLIEPHKNDRRYIRRKKGRFTKKQVNVGRSLAADRRTKAKSKVKKGEGDRGDVRRKKRL